MLQNGLYFFRGILYASSKASDFCVYTWVLFCYHGVALLEFVS